MFIANPNNPTGTFVAGRRDRAFLAAVPRDVVVVLDEAYNEYLAPELQYESTAWVAQFPESAGVAHRSPRPTAWPACASALASRSRPSTDLLNRVRQPFNVNALAQAAAIAALDDEQFLRRRARR